jgi:glyoxylase-like metal-dependent hydrolase (beta-lactamase superfamily II)/rhodanese-related sulfurtransferase
MVRFGKLSVSAPGFDAGSVHERDAVSAPEIGPRGFERELREGHQVVVIDTRDPDALTAWQIDAGARPVINVPEAEFDRDLEQALAAIPREAHLRIICNAGNSSRRVATLLAQQGIRSLSVRGGMIGWGRVVQQAEIPLDAPFRVVQFRREARGCLSYLVSAGQEALVVDPGPDVGPYIAEATAQGVRIARVFDTHVHADHLSGARELADRTGAHLHLSAAALARGCEYADRVAPVTDGDSLDFEDQTVSVVGLPGHTSDMTGLLLGEAAVLAGDSLFIDSVARPDLELGDEGAEAGARRLHQTLRERLGQLPETSLLLPAHYGGGRVEGPVVATLGLVRRRVAELALVEDEFVRRILSQMPERPANYVEIIAANLSKAPLSEESARLEVGANNCAVAIPTRPGRP